MDSTLVWFYICILISIALLLTKDGVEAIILLWILYGCTMLWKVFKTCYKAEQIKEWYVTKQTGKHYVDDNCLMRCINQEEALRLIKERHYDHDREIMSQRKKQIEKGYCGCDFPEPDKIINNDKYWQQQEIKDCYGNIYYDQYLISLELWKDYPELEKAYYEFHKPKPVHYYKFKPPDKSGIV